MPVDPRPVPHGRLVLVAATGLGLRLGLTAPSVSPVSPVLDVAPAAVQADRDGRR